MMRQGSRRRSMRVAEKRMITGRTDPGGRNSWLSGLLYLSLPNLLSKFTTREYQRSTAAHCDAVTTDAYAELHACI
jgi:hypothetical protein